MSRPHDIYDKRKGGLVEWLHDTLPDKRTFFKNINYNPHAAQEQIHAALNVVDTVVGCCGVRFGKSKAGGGEMFFEGMLPRKDFTGWCVGPTADLADIIFNDTLNHVKEGFKATPGAITVRETEGELIFPNYGGGVSRVFRKSTYDAEGKGKLAGRPADFMVVDEGAKVRPDSLWENELRGRLIDRGGKALVISSPMGNRGWFPALFRRGQEPGSGVISIRLPSWSNPFIPKEVWIREKKEATRRAWDQEYAAKFVAVEGNVFSEDDLLAICTGDFRDYQSGIEHFGGIDLALKDDYSVGLIGVNSRPLPEVVYMMRHRRVPKPEQVRQISDMLRTYRAPAYYDGTGLGDAFRDDFTEEGLECYPKLWTVKNKRDMIQHALLLVEKHKIILPKRESAPALFHELASYEWKESGDFAVGEAPSGAHDDCVSAFLMLCQWFQCSGDGSGASVGAKISKPPKGEPVRSMISKAQSPFRQRKAGLRRPFGMR